jgi:hypothetical protein
LDEVAAEIGVYFQIHILCWSLAPFLVAYSYTQ